MSVKTQFFGKYILLDKVAAGGMAEVYRAKAPGADGIGKIIAIKRILPQYSTHSEFIDMFKNEAKIAVNLTQANIGQIYEFGEEENQFFLTMEFIDGRNLRQLLSRCSKIQKPLTIEQCVYILSQIANGLDYAHRCTDKNTGKPLNIIHRDMSPQNVMVSFEGEVKIVDFGIAKAESKIESTRAGTLKGKFGYMSPEQAEGLDLDARTDIFSLGIVLWELLTGERLFVANNEVNTIRKIRECHIPSVRKINPNIHEDLERITNKALARDRSLRYQTASELNRDLSRFLYKINPEFTHQDLSLFVKTLFKDEIIEDRKKVIEYSKVQFPESSKTDKTYFVGEQTSRTATYTETGEAENQPEAPKNFIVDQAASVPKDMSISIKRGDLARQQINHNKNINNNHTQGTSVSKRFNNPNPISVQSVRHEGIISKSMPLILIGAAVLLSFLAFQKDTTKISHWTRSLFTSEFKSQTKQSSLTSTVAETAKVFVYSMPAGAQITIDNNIVGNTPAEVSVQLRKKLSFSLRKDGFLVYTKDFIATKSPDEFRATLQKAKIGYLDIEVQPSNSDIYINGQKLAEKSPVKRYPVAAGTPIRIVAKHPYSNTQDQIQVSVKQDTVKSVRLFLRKSKN